ncbi:unnamed protein product, partial [Timema podura]|nr:unnamed protein product [Timema podura]
WQYLSHCDEVYFMKEGRIAEQGTHQQLMDQKQDYSLMMTTRLTEIQLGDSARVEETVSVQRRSSIGKNSTSSKGSVEEMVEKMNPADKLLTHTFDYQIPSRTAKNQHDPQEWPQLSNFFHSDIKPSQLSPKNLFQTAI